MNPFFAKLPLLLIISVLILPSCNDNNEKPGSPPEINAEISPDTAYVGMAITLDGSDTEDPDNDTLIFNWSIISAPDGASEQLSSDSASAVAFYNVNRAGEYVFEFEVTDNVHDPVSETFTYVVKEKVGSNPTARVPDDQEIPVNEAFTLDGSGSSDPEDGSDLNYNWTLTGNPLGSEAEIQNKTQVNATLTPDTTGNYNIELKVTDSDGNSDRDQVTIKAVNNNEQMD